MQGTYTEAVQEEAPTFIIIGAAKAGTTSLYDDLAEHPLSSMPAVKEPDILHAADSPMDAGKLWRKHFRRLGSNQVRGEGSTYYSMVPEFPNVAGKARAYIGPELKIIYMMRHPIRRIESHLAHDLAAGRLSDMDFDSVVLKQSRYVNWSDYPRQITPWIDEFGLSSILPIIFEEYIEYRQEVVASVAKFVGLDPDLLPERSAISNSRSSLRAIRFGVVDNILSSYFYRTHLRNSLPEKVRAYVREKMTKAAPQVEIKLKPETLVELNRRLAHVNSGLLDLGIRPGAW